MRPRCLPLALAALLAALLPACSVETEASEVAVSAAPRERQLFQAEGTPGPWWRDGATPEEFDRDRKGCLVESRRAREQTRDGGDPMDAAYRAFLDCMEERAWMRGLPPPADAGAGQGS